MENWGSHITVRNDTRISCIRYHILQKVIIARITRTVLWSGLQCHKKTLWVPVKMQKSLSSISSFIDIAPVSAPQALYPLYNFAILRLLHKWKPIVYNIFGFTFFSSSVTQTVYPSCNNNDHLSRVVFGGGGLTVYSSGWPSFCLPSAGTLHPHSAKT